MLQWIDRHLKDEYLVIRQPEVATISVSGLATAVTTGSSVISATAGASIVLNVQ